MPRLQVYLPDDLHREVKRRGLPASELLQKAVREEITKQHYERELDLYLAEQRAEPGYEPPTAEDIAEAEAWAARIKAHLESTRA